MSLWSTCQTQANLIKTKWLHQYYETVHRMDSVVIFLSPWKKKWQRFSYFFMFYFFIPRTTQQEIQYIYLNSAAFIKALSPEPDYSITSLWIPPVLAELYNMINIYKEPNCVWIAVGIIGNTISRWNAPVAYDFAMNLRHA